MDEIQRKLKQIDARHNAGIFADLRQERWPNGRPKNHSFDTRLALGYALLHQDEADLR